MKVNGIIAEYNPFHSGHAYHIEESKKLTGADYTVVVMSGNFVQRGEPSILDKFSRTRMALLGGADLVLELPVCYATGSAEFFAGGAVSLLESLGCVDTLSFGSEAGDISFFTSMAQFLLEEPNSYRCALKEALQRGCTFPAARQGALTSCGIEKAHLLSSPNNILALEYVKALLRLKSSICPVTIKRIGSDYHDKVLSGTYSSASALRESFFRMDELDKTVSDAVPPYVYELLKKQWHITCPVSLSDFSPMLHYRLLMASDEAEFARYFDVSKETAQRIFKLRHQFTDFPSFVSLLKTKNQTQLTLNRALTHILLEILQEPIYKTCFNGYAKVLGFRRSASPLLHAIKEKGRLPLLTKLADASAVLSSYEGFTETQRKDALSMLKTDIRSSMVYHAAVSSKFHQKPYDEYRQQLVIL